MDPEEMQLVTRRSPRMGRRLFVVGVAIAPSLAMPAANALAQQQSSGGGVTPQDVTAPAYRSLIRIVDGSNAEPYASTVSVRGLSGRVADVNLTLKNVTHPSPDDIFVMLATTGRQGAILMGGAGGSGGNNALVNTDIRLDDEAAQPLPPAGPIIGRTAYQPANYDPTVTFGSPAPGAPGQNLAFFDNIEPNTDWTIYIKDAVTNNLAGSLSGWQLEILTDSDLPFVDRITYRTTENKPLRVTVQEGLLQRGGKTNQGGLTVNRLTLPRKGKLKLNSNGSFRYEPKKDKTGNDSFTYQVKDEYGVIGNGKVTIIIK